MKNSTETIERPVEQKSWVDSYDDIHHICCCVDDNMLLCGRDGSELEFVENNGNATCVECGVNDERDVCPLWGSCIET